jgi:hypothetical protein
MTRWDGQYGRSNGSSLEMGMILGRLIASSEQQIIILRTQTEILGEIKHELAQTPARLAEKIPVVTAESKTKTSILEWFDLIRRAGLSLVPISVTVLILTGKISLQEGWTMIMRAVGGSAP